MKFHWFAQFTYPDLPGDLFERGIPTWVKTPAELLESRRIGQLYKMFIRLLQQADRDNFDGLAVNEHHQSAYALSPSPNLLAATLAATTENAAILIIGDSLALYNPPTRVAEEMGYIDCLSEGRLIAGFVFGTPMDSTMSYGIPPIELRERFHEARKLILRAWDEQTPFPFNGQYHQLRYVNVLPKPIQKRPPIWVPGSGSVETWDLVVDENYCYGHLSFSGLHSAKPLVDAYWDHVDKRGGDTNPHRMAFTQLICCADTDAEAEKQYYEAVRYFYRNNIVEPGFQTPPGYTTIRSQKAMAARLKTAPNLKPKDRIRAAKGEMSFWEYDEKGYIIAGTPERVRQRVRELVLDLRVGQLIGCLHMGNLAEEVAAQNTHLFGTRVIPGLQDIWGDWPDHWTPEVSQTRLAARRQASLENEGVR